MTWWCNTFGHSFVTRPMVEANPMTWLKPTAIPLATFCRRCGYNHPGNTVRLADSPSPPSAPTSTEDTDA